MWRQFLWRTPVRLGDRVKIHPARLVYFNGMAGRRLRVFVVGSTMIPTDSSAVIRHAAEWPAIWTSRISDDRSYTPDSYALSVESEPFQLVQRVCREIILAAMGTDNHGNALDHQDALSSAETSRYMLGHGSLLTAVITDHKHLSKTIDGYDNQFACDTQLRDDFRRGLYLLLAFSIVSPTMSLPSLRIRMSSPISIVSVARWGLRKLI